MWYARQFLCDQQRSDGLLTQLPGETTYASSVSFIGTSIGALHLLMTSVLSTEPWLRDPKVMPIPWRQEITDTTLQRAAPDGSSNDALPLKLGVFWTDGVVTPQPPISRGLHLVADAVRKAGHKASRPFTFKRQDSERAYVERFFSLGYR